MEKEGNPSPVVRISRAGKHRRRRKKNKGWDRKGDMVVGHHRLLCFAVWLLISLIIVMASSPWNVRYACKKVRELMLNVK
jgi:hypothetical protein